MARKREVLPPTAPLLRRLIQGFGATGAQNLGFPIDFDSRPYNSVTHYRATVWLLLIGSV